MPLQPSSREILSAFADSAGDTHELAPRAELETVKNALHNSIEQQRESE